MNVGAYVPSILKGGPDCPDCGDRMVPTTVYHPGIHEPVDAWECTTDGCNARPRIRDDSPKTG